MSVGIASTMRCGISCRLHVGYIVRTIKKKTYSMSIKFNQGQEEGMNKRDGYR